VIRLLAIDIDGTLLDSRGHVPDAHRDALVDAAAAGVEVALATGRSFHFTRPIAHALPLPLTLIVNNGALVKDGDGTTRLRHLLDRDVARAVLAGTTAYEDSVALVFDRAPADEERQILFERMDWEHPNRRGYFEKNQAFIGTASPLAGALTEDPIASRFSVALTEYAHRDFSLVDVNGEGCSKGATLERWAAERGLAREDVMAVGDNFNDAEMLEFAGTPVVMGNACAELKARGWPVTASNDEGGLAEAIRQFALAPQRP